MWRTPVTGKSLGGVAATDKYVIASGRALGDTADLWVCLDAETGKQFWAVRYPAPGGLDYGNSPRATPLIHGDLVILAGAFGHLCTAELSTGKVLWKKDTRAEFNVTEELPWGHCGSPLVADGKLILYPGGPDAAIVALDLRTGAVVWKTPGGPPGYGSLLAGTFGGIQQVIGHDATALHGWDLATGKRLWSVEPPRPKDFNVATPIAWNGRLIVATENNGTRMFQFKASGVIDPEPVANCGELAPDTYTPVVAGDRLFGVHEGLHCLDLAGGFKRLWHHPDDELRLHASAFTSGDRVLIVTHAAEAVLVDARADSTNIVDRRKLVPDEADLYAHPAVANHRLYVRGADAVHCFRLE